MGFAYYGITSKNGAKRLADLEYNSELRGENAYRVYERMRLSDPKVYGLRRAQDLPLIRATASFGSADPDVKNTKAQEVADFCERVFFDRMAGGWRSFMQTASLYADYGFAPFEIIWASENGEVFIDRLAYRPPKTIRPDGIYLNNGRIDHITQWRSDGQTADIPGDKLLWLCHDKDGDNYRGRPILRAMYKPWYNKEHAEILLLCHLEKGGGVPYVAETNALDAAARAEVDAALEDLRLSDRVSMRTPPGSTFKIEPFYARLSEGLELVKYWDWQLSQACQAQVLDLGATQTGSRALGNVLSDMFTAAIDARKNYIEDVFNAQGGIVHQLVSYNFPNSDDLVPKLRFGSTERRNISVIAKAMADLKTAGLLTPDPDLEEFIRSELDLPASSTEQVIVPPLPAAVVAPAAPVAPNASPTPAAAPESAGAAAAEHVHDAPFLLADTGTKLWREPRGVELFCDLADIGATFDLSKSAVKDATADVRMAMVRELVSRAQTAVATGDPKRVSALAQQGAPMIDALTAAIRPVYFGAYTAGRQQVASELERQKNGTPVVQNIVDARQSGQLVMADIPKTPKNLPKPGAADVTPEADTYATEAARVAARAIAANTVAETAHQAVRALSTPITDEAMATMVDRASEAGALRAGFAIINLVDMGRGDQAQADPDMIADCTYSAVLDGSVCGVCEADDGQESTDLAEAVNWTPNPECEGGDRCRCLTIFSYDQGASQ